MENQLYKGMHINLLKSIPWKVNPSNEYHTSACIILCMHVCECARASVCVCVCVCD